MRIHHQMSGNAYTCTLKWLGGLFFGVSLVLVSLPAQAASLSGESTTILRARGAANDRYLVPLYEYLNLSLTQGVTQGALELYLGGWGRGDLADRSTGEGHDGALQYGYLSYRDNRNNLQAKLGRQWVTEGVASDRIDGLFLKSDVAAGFTVSAFVGHPVTTEPNYKGGSILYGGRVGWAKPSWVWIGLSALKGYEGDHSLREEEGIDLWLRPLPQLDITGRSSYNSLSEGWMEHAYTASFSFAPVLLSVSLNQANYRDYFHHTTTSAFGVGNSLPLNGPATPFGFGSIIDPREEVLSLGGLASVNLGKYLTLSADYRHYDYEVAGNAHFFGGGGSFTLPALFDGGFSYHRMDGSDERHDYDQYRVYLTRKLGKADLTLDFFDVAYDSRISGRKNTFSIAGAVGYQFSPQLRVTADMDYLRSADLDNDLRGLFKVIYAFASERRGQK